MSLELGYLNDSEIELVAKASGVTIETVKKAQEIYLQGQILSLDSVIEKPYGSGETFLGELVAVDLTTPSPEDNLFVIERNQRLLTVMDKLLRGRELRVLKLRFGFETGTPMTLEEIGSIYGVTRERIRQIKAKALKKLRRHLEKDGKDKWLVD